MQSPKAGNVATVIAVAGVGFTMAVTPASVSSVSIVGISVSGNESFLTQGALFIVPRHSEKCFQN